MNNITFGAFFLMWATRMGWTVPEVHWRAIHWLSDYGDLGVLRCFRGFGKSTIVDVYFAWRIYCQYTYRVLLQSESDGTALKSSRDVQNILRNHPLTRGIIRDDGTVESWWTFEGKEADPRNPQFYAKGVLSNTTGSRADEAVNDDVEVPRNITSPELREKLRYRVNEQTHILVPGARQLFVGTPHAFDSIYDEQEALGANCLTIPLFTNEFRIENARTEKRFDIGFHPVFVFAGIGKGSRVLRPFIDYTIDGHAIEFAEVPAGVIDIYGQSSWPERFDRKELINRRKKTRTLGEWDSQYLLRSRPVHKLRLDPDNLREYNCELEFRTANRETTAWLGAVQITGASCYWDVSTGKRKADDSAVSVVLTDARGHLYWHDAVGLEGDLAQFNENGQISGGQVWQLRQLVIKYNLPRVVVEVNGVGSFAGKLLKQALKGLVCGVAEIVVTGNKQARILEGLEGPLSGNFLWAHSRVIDGPVYDQMREFNPALTNQADDFIDSGSGAVQEQPIKIGSVQKEQTAREHGANWRTNGGTFEVLTD